MRIKKMQVVLLAVTSVFVCAIANAQGPSASVQPNATGGFDVYPTGVDDHSNVEWALAEAAPGSTVNLIGDHFFLSRTVDAINFSGTLRGLGMESTVVHAMDSFGYSQFLYDGWGTTDFFIFYFGYDSRLGYGWSGEGHLAISDFKMVVDGDVDGTWLNHGVPSKEVAAGIFVNDFGIFETGYGFPTGVNVTFERLWFVAQTREGEYYPWGANLLWPINTYLFAGGEYVVRDIRLEGTSFMYFEGFYDSVLDISDIESTSITYGGSTVIMVEMRKCSVSVSGVDTTGASGFALWNDVVWNGAPLEPSMFVISHNEIDQQPNPDWAGIEIWDFPIPGVASTFVVEHNKIHSEDVALWGPIWLLGTQHALVANNIITGHGPAAIYAGVDYWGGGGDNQLTLLGNNVQGWDTVASGFLPSIAPIWLGWATSDSTVIGNGKNVADYGTNNTVTGMNNMGPVVPPDTLGQDISATLKQRRELP
jgi:hypothetical protein